MGKKGKCPEFENHERWLVSYADMLTLLFAVFVVLFALKEGGEPQVQNAAGSMQESFNTPLDDIPLDRRAGPSEQGFGIFEHFKGNRILPPLNPKYPASRPSKKTIDEEMILTKKRLEERLYGPKTFPDKKSPGQERILDIRRTENGFMLKLMGRHFYRDGEVSLREEAYDDINEIAKVLKSLGRNIAIEGHTDTLPPKGGYTQWEMSTLRATHFVSYLIEKHRFPQTRLKASGYGSVKPIAHNGTKAGRQLNRRIEIQIEYQPEWSSDPIP